MNEHSILSLQIEALREDLTHIQNILNALQSGAIVPASSHSDLIELLSRVSTRLEQSIETNVRALKKLDSDIESNVALSNCWKDLREIRHDSKRLFQVCLALIEGALVRQYGFDGGLCRIADALLDELNLMSDSGWRRFTIWSDAESFTKLDEVIRVRFPSVNIWHLPVAAHEFGHFVSENLQELGTVRRPFQELCDSYKGKPEAPFLSEYFSDVFATYTLGPAYVSNCVVLRFDHGAANYPDSTTHPSPDKRVYVMLRTLSNLDKAAGTPFPYEYISGKLIDLWRHGLKTAFQAVELDEEVKDDLDDLCDKIYDIVSRHLPSRVRYSGWLRAQQLASVLRSTAKLEFKLVHLQPGDTIINVVNAAWLERVLNSYSAVALRDLSDDALGFCNAIVTRRKKP